MADGGEWEVAEPVDFDAGENGRPFAVGFGVPELVDGSGAEDDEEVFGAREETGDVASEAGDVGGEADGGEPRLVGDWGDAAFISADGEGWSGGEEPGAVAVGEEDGGGTERDDEVRRVGLVGGGEEFDEGLFAVWAIESGAFEGGFGEFDWERGLCSKDGLEFLGDGVERCELAAEGLDDEDVARGGGGGLGWSGVAVGGDEEGAEESDVEETRHGWGRPRYRWQILNFQGRMKHPAICGRMFQGTGFFVETSGPLADPGAGVRSRLCHSGNRDQVDEPGRQRVNCHRGENAGSNPGHAFPRGQATGGGK